MTELNKLRYLIEKKLDSIELPKSPNNLYDPLRYIIKIGGKRIRPILTLLASSLFGETIENSLNKALSLELFHNFSLIHDDIMDEAPLRRKQQTVHQKWNTNIGILAGDAMLIKSYQFMIKDHHKKNINILNLYNKIAIEVCEGQQMDIDFENLPQIDGDTYLEMIRKKTAILIGCALQIGAMNANAPEKDAKELYLFGEKIGIAFQLQDDYLDAFANPETFGKQIGGDILANKKTYLLIRAMEKANSEQKEAIINCLEIKNPTLKIEIMLNLFRELDIRKEVNQKMEEFYLKAIYHLDKISIKGKEINILKQIAKYFLKRDE